MAQIPTIETHPNLSYPLRKNELGIILSLDHSGGTNEACGYCKYWINRQCSIDWDNIHSCCLDLIGRDDYYR